MIRFSRHFPFSNIQIYISSTRSLARQQSLNKSNNQETIMEKAAKSKGRILSFLPKAAGAINFQNLPFSPINRDKRSDIKKYKSQYQNRGLSGPVLSVVPADNRRKSKYDSVRDDPTSPTVSCIGQIKHKKKKKIPKAKKIKEPKKGDANSNQIVVVKKQKPSIGKFFRSATTGRKLSEETIDNMTDKVPSLGQMKKFSSGRDTFANFEWTTQIAPVDLDHERDYFSDEEDESEDDDEEGEVVGAPFSAPVMVSGLGVASLKLKPKEEINLWKRRSFDRPNHIHISRPGLR